jgi:oxygen-dependent protoporphyrinogen oxidase
MARLAGQDCNGDFGTSHLPRKLSMAHAASPLTSDVIVVGAGLSGLTAAFELAEHGHDVEVLESALHPGGVIGSHRRDVGSEQGENGEALYEHGPNSGMDTSPRVNELLHALGIFDERINAEKAAARRYILRDGRLVTVPAGPLQFITTPLLSARAKLALLREPFVPPAPAGVEEDVAHFVERRLGREVLDYGVEPLVGGIYAGNPQEISVAAAFPKLHALEQRYGSIVRGAVFGARERKLAAAERGEIAKHAAQSFSFRGGMQTLTNALALRVSRVICAARVESVQPQADGTFLVTMERRGERVERRARAVVLAVPAYEAAKLVLPLAVDVANALEAIVYPPLATVSAAYRRADVQHPLDGFGFLAPRVESPPVLGTLFTSSMFQHRAPPGFVLLTSFVGGRRNPELAQGSEQLIGDNVLRSSERFLGARKPRFVVVKKWPRAIPQYTLGHGERLVAVARLEARFPGLVFCSNWRGGVSISDCIDSGLQTGAQLHRWLQAPASDTAAASALASAF